MLKSGALPINQQIVLDLLVPPAVTAVWWLLTGGWSIVLGESASPNVVGRKRPATLDVLAVCYIVAFSITIYGYLI